MPKLKVFNHVTLDGYFCDKNGDMSWAHARQDAEWADFASSNARGGGKLLFGRVTYQMMASYWPTPQAKASMPVVADGMNNMSKVVFSRTLDKAEWQNTELINTDPVAAVRKLKAESGPDMVIMGSGTIIAQLAAANVIDEYQLVLNPVALGRGRTLFDGMDKQLNLTLRKQRAFGNGNLVLWYDAS